MLIFVVPILFPLKNVLLTLVLVLSQVAVFPQDQPADKSAETDYSEIRTVFKKPAQPVEVGDYIGPEGAWTQFDGRNVFLGGLSMDVIVDHFFSVGLAGYGILNSGVSYRYTPDLDLVSTKTGLINDLNVNFSVKFGKF